MAKRPKKNDVPAKTPPKTTVFQPQGAPAPRPPHTAAMSHTIGGDTGGLTRNRSKPSGGPGSAGPITRVE